LAGEEIVPWLAAEGELAYSPSSPPERDYFFQYSWVIPGIFAPDTNRRRHFWFGAAVRDSAEVKLLFRFWNRARRGDIDTLYVANGAVNPNANLTAPIAAYRHQDDHSYFGSNDRLILMQHGSYYIGDIQCQPVIDRGELILYRGVQNEKTFRLYRLTDDAKRGRLMRVHARSLADSVTSFNAAHCNLLRCETGAFNDRSFLFDLHCRLEGLDEDDVAVRSALYSGYALEEWCASRKFGPHYVKLRTPLTNVRITTFVANETEIKVIDPNKLQIVEAIGCRVQEVGSGSRNSL
jgi:hypothetical protein